MMRRWWLGGLAALLLLAAPLAVKLAVERGLLTAALDAALERAAGRPVALGRITLGWGRITVLDARIANIPGATQPDFARVGRLELNLALRPLLSGRLDIRDLLLADAEIWLERDATGAPNWVFGAGSDAGGAMPLPALRLPALRLAAVRLHLPDDLPGPLAIEALQLRQVAESLHLQGRASLREEPVRLDLRLNQTASTLSGSVTGEGFRLSAEGRIAQRLSDAGWDVALAAEVASPARLMALLGQEASLPPPSLPRLGPLTGTARLGPGGRLTEIAIRAGASTPFPGWRVTQASLSAAALEAPMRLAVQGPRGALDVTLPSPRLAFTTAAPMPVTLRASAGAARLTATGSFTWSDPFARPFDVTLTAPALAPLGSLLGLDLPPLREVQAQGRLARTGAAPLRWEAARLAATGVVASGALTLDWAGRPRLRGTLQFANLDLDSLLPAGPPRAPQPGRLIPDLALPVAELRGFDATLDLGAERVTAGGLTWRGLRTRATLDAGRLELADLAVTTPGGPVSGRLGWDVAQTPPAARLTLRSAGHGLDVAAIRRQLGAGIGVQGPVELALDLTARGATTRALAASLAGSAGIAMVEGRISRAGMFRIGPDLTRILLMGRAPPEGVEIRCFALALTAEEGLLQSEALLLESAAGRITGSLAVNLRNENLAAQLRPDLRVMGATMRAPVGIGGTLAAPRVGVEPGQALAQVVGDTVANRLWRSSTVEWLRRGEAGAEDDCASQLRRARLGRAGREPAQAPSAIIPLVPRELQAPVQDVFRGLGGLLGVRR